MSQADLDWVTQRRKETDLTNAQIVLGAIEATEQELSSRFRTATPTKGSGLFSTPTTRTRRATDRHVQLGLSGILASDRAVLDQLVIDTGAGSLSALVRAALRVARTSQA